ncbi:MAG: TPM domain-containing protein [Bacteroidales bacterium]|nr:TPM domain-containing protein [Bacteroidales bacterium]
MKKLSAWVLLILLFATVRVARSAEIPYLTGRVNDYAQILSENGRELLGAKLKEHEDRTTNQIVVLTIPSLEGESIEDYSNLVYNEWKLGLKDRDNGILIVVVPYEKQMRIEVGYGLEGVITDLMAGRIIREIMAPMFREGDFEGGITEGALAVIGVLEGQELPEYMNESSDSSSYSGFSDLESPDMSLGARILLVPLFLAS